MHLSNSYLQTRCSDRNREDNTSGRLKDEELFPRKVFPLWEVVLYPTLVCVTRVRKSGVFLLLSILSMLSILSTFLPSFRLGLHCVCPSMVLPAFFSNNDTVFLFRQFCNLCRQFFCIFGLGFSLSFLSSLAALAVSSPFRTLRATTLFRVQSCVDFLLRQIFPALSLFEFYFGSLLFRRGFFIATSLILFISLWKFVHCSFALPFISFLLRRI